MTTFSYALSRTERACLQYSIAFLVSALFYALIPGWAVNGMEHRYLTTVLLDFPVMLLISLSAGFLFTTAGHYAIRQAFRNGSEREEVL